MKYFQVGRLPQCYKETFQLSLDICNQLLVFGRRGGSWLVRSTPERAVRVGALAGATVLCSWARHFTLTVPPSTKVYKWVPANCWGNPTNCGEVTCDGLASRSGEVEILLAASSYRNRDKLRLLWASLGSKASLNHLLVFIIWLECKNCEYFVFSVIIFHMIWETVRYVWVFS